MLGMETEVSILIGMCINLVSCDFFTSRKIVKSQNKYIYSKARVTNVSQYSFEFICFVTLCNVLKYYILAHEKLFQCIL